MMVIKTFKYKKTSLFIKSFNSFSMVFYLFIVDKNGI